MLEPQRSVELVHAPFRSAPNWPRHAFLAVPRLDEPKSTCAARRLVEFGACARDMSARCRSNALSLSHGMPPWLGLGPVASLMLAIGLHDSALKQLLKAGTRDRSERQFDANNC